MTKFPLQISTYPIFEPVRQVSLSTRTHRCHWPPDGDQSITACLTSESHVSLHQSLATSPRYICAGMNRNKQLLRPELTFETFLVGPPSGPMSPSKPFVTFRAM